MDPLDRQKMKEVARHFKVIVCRIYTNSIGGIIVNNC